MTNSVIIKRMVQDDLPNEACWDIDGGAFIPHDDYMMITLQIRIRDEVDGPITTVDVQVPVEYTEKTEINALAEKAVHHLKRYIPLDDLPGYQVGRKLYDENKEP